MGMGEQSSKMDPVCTHTWNRSLSTVPAGQRGISRAMPQLQRQKCLPVAGVPDPGEGRGAAGPALEALHQAAGGQEGGGAGPEGQGGPGAG